MHFKTGDKVVVISGKDKGKEGTITKVLRDENRVVVEGVNIVKKHVKPRKQGEEGGIIPVECAIDSSKVNVVCSKCGKATRVEYKVEDDKKVRICKKCGAVIK